MIKYKVLHCTDNINALPLQRIGNNVEAFRYYLAFEIWTISTQQDNGQMTPALMLLYICL
jgi:hypothetical protein